VGVGPELEEAARTLGASPWRAVVGVVLPLMRGGVLAGMILSFVISFNEFTVTFFLYTADVATVPIWFYSRTVASLDPTVFALAVLIVLLDAIMIYGLERLVGPDALVA
jgi:putative spermidine/putrescine transport system permease protein